MIRVLKKRKKIYLINFRGRGRRKRGEQRERREKKGASNRKCGTRKGYANNKKLTIGEEKQGRNFFFLSPFIFVLCPTLIGFKLRIWHETNLELHPMVMKIRGGRLENKRFWLSITEKETKLEPQQ